jgi:transcription factor IIIB subunit 2
VELTVYIAKAEIRRIAGMFANMSVLNDQALNFYLLGFKAGALAGRNLTNVCCVMLYLTCRQRESDFPYILLDFADKLQRNPTKLGRILLDYLAVVHIPLPAYDPCVLVPRYVARLHLGADEAKVTDAALRIVARMDRDWLVVGRNPAGVCGAAMHVAMKSYGIQRPLREIVEVVRVCQRTLYRRLEEFLNTKSAELTLDEFQAYDLDEEEPVPPTFPVAKLEPVDEEAFSRQWETVKQEMANLMEEENRLEELRQELQQKREEKEENNSGNEEEGNEEEEGEGLEESLSEMDEAEMKQFILTNKHLIKRKQELWMERFGKFEEERLEKKKNAPPSSSKKPRKKKKLLDLEDPGSAKRKKLTLSESQAHLREAEVVDNDMSMGMFEDSDSDD